MRFSLLAILVAAFLSVPYLAQADESSDFDVRKVKWDMSKDEVRASEIGTNMITNYLDTGDVLKGSEGILYKGKVGDSDIGITYLFVKDKLKGVFYMFLPDQFQSVEQCAARYHAIKESLGTKYKPFDPFSEIAPLAQTENDRKLLELAKKDIARKYAYFQNDRTHISLQNECAKQKSFYVKYLEKEYYEHEKASKREAEKHQKAKDMKDL